MQNWFIIQTNPNCEAKATRELRRMGCRVYIPQRAFEHRDRRTGEKSVKHRPLLTGYILIRFTPETIGTNGTPQFGLARQCQGVKNFVRVANEADEWEPFPIPEKIVAQLMRRQRAREFGRPEIEKSQKRMDRLRNTYRRGKRMRIAEGPFASFLAKIDRLRKDGKLEVEIDVLGRPTRLLLDDPDFYLRSAA